MAVQKGKLKKKKEEEKELQEELKLRLPSGELDELNQKNNKAINRISTVIQPKNIEEQLEEKEEII